MVNFVLFLRIDLTLAADVASFLYDRGALQNILALLVQHPHEGYLFSNAAKSISNIIASDPARRDALVALDAKRIIASALHFAQGNAAFAKDALQDLKGKPTRPLSPLISIQRFPLNCSPSIHTDSIVCACMNARAVVKVCCSPKFAHQTRKCSFCSFVSVLLKVLALSTPYPTQSLTSVQCPQASKRLLSGMRFSRTDSRSQAIPIKCSLDFRCLARHWSLLFSLPLP